MCAFLRYYLGYGAGLMQRPRGIMTRPRAGTDLFPINFRFAGTKRREREEGRLRTD
jgi:hypothetical protein